MTPERDIRETGIGSPSARWLAPVGLALAVQLGCAAGDAGDDGPVVRDSAGVTIVDNVHREWPAGEGWRLSGRPILEIGVLDGDEPYQLFRVSDALRLPDGRVAVGNGGSQELRFFDADGRFLESLGRKGEGPGEFQTLGGIDLFGGADSLGVYDWRLRRVSVFNLDGDFVRSFPIQFPTGSPRPVGPFDDGTWLCNTNMAFRPGDVSTVRRDTAAYYVFGRDGTLQDSLFDFPSGEFFVQGDRQFVMATSLPFGRGPQHAVIANGFWAGVTDRYEITRYAQDGTPQLILRKEHAPVPVTRTDVDRAKAERLDRTEDANLRRRTERLFADMPIPSTMPAFASLMVDAVGNVWVAEYLRPGDDPQAWSVFDADGRMLGTVRTPRDLRVRQIGQDFLLGTWRDELDVEQVQVYELLKPTPP